mgnify:FL=1
MRHELTLPVKFTIDTESVIYDDETKTRNWSARAYIKGIQPYANTESGKIFKTEAAAIKELKKIIKEMNS